MTDSIAKPIFVLMLLYHQICLPCDKRISAKGVPKGVHKQRPYLQLTSLKWLEEKEGWVALEAGAAEGVALWDYPLLPWA